jgi:hypothetical protein
MAAHCRSCFRDLPSDDAECVRCLRSEPDPAGFATGLLLFGLTMAGILTFDLRLCITGAVLALFLLVVRIARMLQRVSM